MKLSWMKLSSKQIRNCNKIHLKRHVQLTEHPVKENFKVLTFLSKLVAVLNSIRLINLRFYFFYGTGEHTCKL